MISAILLGILLGPPHAFTKTHVHSWARRSRTDWLGQGLSLGSPGDCQTHGGKMTNAGSNAYECIVLGWIH